MSKSYAFTAPRRVVYSVQKKDHEHGRSFNPACSFTQNNFLNQLYVCFTIKSQAREIKRTITPKVTVINTQLGKLGNSSFKSHIVEWMVQGSTQHFGIDLLDCVLRKSKDAFKNTVVFVLHQ